MAALSADTFAAGLAYGAGGIRLPPASLAAASAVSSLVLGLSMLAGRLAGTSLPAGAVKVFGFLILALLGLWKLLVHSGGKKAEEADKNKDRLVSLPEALTLGAALSADSLAAGIGAVALNTPLLAAVAASFLAGAAAFAGGGRLGRALCSRGGDCGRGESSGRGGDCSRGESSGRDRGRGRGESSGRGRDRSQDGGCGPERLSGFLLLILAFSKLL